MSQAWLGIHLFGELLSKARAARPRAGTGVTRVPEDLTWLRPLSRATDGPILFAFPPDASARLPTTNWPSAPMRSAGN